MNSRLLTSAGSPCQVWGVGALSAHPEVLAGIGTSAEESILWMDLSVGAKVSLQRSQGGDGASGRGLDLLQEQPATGLELQPLPGAL